MTVEKANPEKPFNSRKKAVKEFNGVINYEKLRVAAGSLVIPEIRAEVDMENRRIFSLTRRKKSSPLIAFWMIRFMPCFFVRRNIFVVSRSWDFGERR